MNYYNEFDKKTANWLRDLIASNLIPNGVVDDRSIVDVTANDLKGFTQCHFFAGIAGWSLALDLAGWPRDRQIWTGSCPCQPFSAAGKGKGFSDERHLWPTFFNLIKQCEPDDLAGEQVASQAGLAWLDTVHADLESAGYAVGAIDTCSPSVGAPNVRQRLVWVAHSVRDRREQRGTGAGNRSIGWSSSPDGLADAHGERRDGEQIQLLPRRQVEAGDEAVGSGGNSRLADTVDQGSQGGLRGRSDAQRSAVDGHARRHSAVVNSWADPEWLYCRDGLYRPIERGLKPLVDGVSEKLVRKRDPLTPIEANETSIARVLRLKGYGNAINPVAVAAVIESYMEVIDHV